jgi:hypothetical protein
LINVCDDRRRDVRVADVYLVHVAAAYLIWRHVNFTRTKGEPADVVPEPSRTTAEENHEGGSIHGMNFRWPSDPSPTSASRDPAPVVERSVAPAGIIYPGIAPRRDPIPMTGMIRCPARFYSARVPDMTVVGIVAPVAVVVEIFVANNVR